MCRCFVGDRILTVPFRLQVRAPSKLCVDNEKQTRLDSRDFFFSVTSYRKEPAQSQDRVGTSVARED